MANIECNDINQVINELLVAFQDCAKIKSSDLTKMVELIAAVNECAGGGPNYDNLHTITYSTMQTVTYPSQSFHSFTLNVLEGSIEYEGFNFPAGTTRNVEYTTLNQNPVTFIVNNGGKVMFEYLTT